MVPLIDMFRKCFFIFYIKSYTIFFTTLFLLINIYICFTIIFCVSFSNDDEPNLVVTTSHISCTDDLKVVKKWADFFNICALNIQSKWDENITHLIVKTPVDNMCPRTLKSMYALLSGCCIVDFEWIQQCLSSRTLIPEVYLHIIFIVLNNIYII